MIPGDLRELTREELLEVLTRVNGLLGEAYATIWTIVDRPGSTATIADLEVAERLAEAITRCGAVERRCGKTLTIASFAAQLSGVDPKRFKAAIDAGVAAVEVSCPCRDCTAAREAAAATVDASVAAARAKVQAEPKGEQP